MSKFSTIEVEFKDRDCIVETLEEMGYPVEVSSLAGLTLNGYYEADTLQNIANIVIRKHNLSVSSNDLGFQRTATGYKMLISDYDKDHLMARGGKLFVKSFTERYGLRVAVSAAQRLGFKQVATTDINGRPRIEMRRW